MVQMAATDVRPHAESLQRISERLPVRPRASSKFKLELHLGAPHWIATYRTRRACARAAERAVWFGCGQSAAQDRFAGFLSQDWLVGHGSPPRMAVPVHAPAHGAHHGEPRWKASRNLVTPGII